MLPIEKEWNRKELHSGNWVFVSNTIFMFSYCEGLCAFNNTVHYITRKSIAIYNKFYNVMMWLILMYLQHPQWWHVPHWCVHCCNVWGGEGQGGGRSGLIPDHQGHEKAETSHGLQQGKTRPHSYSIVYCCMLDLLDSHAIHYTIRLTQYADISCHYTYTRVKSNVLLTSVSCTNYCNYSYLRWHVFRLLILHVCWWIRHSSTNCPIVL